MEEAFPDAEVQFISLATFAAAVRPGGRFQFDWLMFSAGRNSGVRLARDSRLTTLSQRFRPGMLLNRDAE